MLKQYHFYFLFLISFNLLAASNGERLFSKHCSACHGADGNGGVGIPLTLPDFQYGVTNEYLEKTIRLGRPGRVMPAFTELSNKEIKSIVAHIRSWAPGQPFKYSNEKITGNIKNGKIIYKQRCASCHGENGEGGKGTGVTFSRPRDLPIIAPALNNPGFLASAPDHLIKTVLMNGREGTPMLSFLKQGLTEDEINDVTAFVRSFEKKSSNKITEAPDSPLISYTSALNLDDTVSAIKRAISGKNFRIIRTQYLNQGLVKQGMENKKQIIIYFCNFNFLNRALAIDPRVGLFLPCRITAVENKGKVNVMSINPLYMSKYFNNEELHKLCEEMFQTYTDIIEESTF